MLRDEVSQETRMTDVKTQGQLHDRDQSRRQTSRKAQLSCQDASPIICFDTEHAQFTEGSQQLLRLKRIVDRQRRRRTSRQRAKTKENSVCIKRDARIFASKHDTG